MKRVIKQNTRNEDKVIRKTFNCNGAPFVLVYRYINIFIILSRLKVLHSIQHYLNS
jgi:hypothetical protein